MPKTQNQSENYSFSYRGRPRHHRMWSPGECCKSPLTTSVRDTRVWKTVLDRMDIQCGVLQQMRRETSCRFEVTTTDDIMAGVTEVLDRASSDLADQSFNLKPASPDLVRCKMADGVPDKLLFTLEEDGRTTIGCSPCSSNSSTLSDSSTLTSDGTLVASDGSEEGAGGGIERRNLAKAFSPAMDCERLPDDASSRSDGSDGGVEDGGGTRSTWREAICFRQYHRLNHPKMSWRRAHESVRRRRLLGTGKRQGRGSRAWSPRLNVSWTSIEEEIAKQGLLSSPIKLTPLVSPLKVPVTVLVTNGTQKATDLKKELPPATEQNKDFSVVDEYQDGNRKQRHDTDHNHPTEDLRKVKDAPTLQDKQGVRGKRNDTSRVAAMTERRPVESSQIKDLPGIPAAWRVGLTRNTNHGNNTAKHTGKAGRCGDPAAVESDGEADSKLASVMEQYVTAEPFVPEGKPKATGSRAADGAAVKNVAKPSHTRNPKLASKTGDASSKSKGEQNVIDHKSTEENAKEHQRLLASLLQPLTKTAPTFQREQLPIPVIEQGVVHHRHQSPPTTTATQQTTEGSAHTNTTNKDINHVTVQGLPKQNMGGTPYQNGEQIAAVNNADRLNGPPTQALSGQSLVAPNRGGPQEGGDDGRYRYPLGMNNALPVAPNLHQQQQQTQGVSLDQEPTLTVRQTGGATGGGGAAPPGIPGPALWNPSAGVAMAVSAFCQQHRHPAIQQIPAQMPYHQMQLGNWAAGRQYPNGHQQQYPSQGMPNHAQQLFPNGRHPQDLEQLLPMMQPHHPSVNGRQQDQVPMMRTSQLFANGRQQDQVSMMQPQPPFANVRQQDQVPLPFTNGRQQQEQLPMMQHGQQRPSVMLEDPCVLYAQPNYPQTGHNNNNLRSGFPPRPPTESINQPHINQPRGHQLGQGHQYQLNLRQPFPQSHYQPHNNNNNNNNSNQQ